MILRSCCGCWSALTQPLQTRKRTGGRYLKVAKYNEREYTIEFENLIEEEDFYAPPQHAVSEVERELLVQGNYDKLMKHQHAISKEQDEMLRQTEENAKLEDEAYVQAKKEASLASRQARKQVNDKERLKNMKTFKNEGFSKWLSKENEDELSKEMDIEDFEGFLEKVKSNSDSIGESGVISFEQTLSQGLQATKIAGDALNALQPVELHAVSNVGLACYNSLHDNVLHDNIPETSNNLIETSATQEKAVELDDSYQGRSFSLKDVDVSKSSSEGEDGDEFISANSQDGCFEELLI